MPRKLWVARKALSTQHSAKLPPSAPLQQEQESTNSRPEHGECSPVWFESDMHPQAHTAKAGSHLGCCSEVCDALMKWGPDRGGTCRGAGLSSLGGEPFKVWCYPGDGVGVGWGLYCSFHLLAFPMCRDATSHPQHHYAMLDQNL